VEEPEIRLIETKFFVDGAPVFESSDPERLRTKLEVVDDRATKPGEHELTTHVRLRNLQRGENFNVVSKMDVDVKPVGGTCVTVTVDFRSGEGLSPEERAILIIHKWDGKTLASDELTAQVPECQRAPTEACVKEAAVLLRTHPGEAARILSLACDANIASGCAELGMALREDGALPTDDVRADEALAKACRLDPGYCD
jgi:hypothetical protein